MPDLSEEVQEQINDFVEFYYKNGYRCKRKAFENYKHMDPAFYSDYWVHIMRAIDLAKEKYR